MIIESKVIGGLGDKKSNGGTQYYQQDRVLSMGDVAMCIPAQIPADKRKYGHPTIKPVNIIENLIINSSKPGDIVLDCFMGSGTTGVACLNTKRDFIGIELNNEYFATAQNRIKERETEIQRQESLGINPYQE